MKQNMHELETKLDRMKMHSRGNPKMEFRWLIEHFTKENLIYCFHELDRKKAVGIDGVTKDEYAKDLEANVEELVTKMKAMEYYPSPVKEVLIPKSNGKLRPLGIAVIEDKMVQSLFKKILSAIYEPTFTDQSYGFREGRNCHGAIGDLRQFLNKKFEGTIIDVDLSNFFGTINHRKLVLLLEMRIKDRTFIKYIVRMLKAGVLSDGDLRMSDEGSPQGSMASPVLANIFAHYAIDLWVKKLKHTNEYGEIYMVRYADDCVIYTKSNVALTVMEALRKRLDRFSLVLNTEKTKIISFSKNEVGKGNKQETFSFLGFTFYLGRSRMGVIIVKVKTAKKTFASKVKEINTWCRKNRSKFRLKYLWKIFQSKIRGHIQYYGVSFNFEMISTFISKATKIFFKWMNRRSQKRSFNWEKFVRFREIHPLPKPKIVHRLF